MARSGLHTHFSGVAALHVFLAVLIVGTPFRLIALHLAASGNPKVSALGQALLFQY